MTFSQSPVSLNPLPVAVAGLGGSRPRRHGVQEVPRPFQWRCDRLPHVPPPRTRSFGTVVQSPSRRRGWPGHPRPFERSPAVPCSAATIDSIQLSRMSKARRATVRRATWARCRGGADEPQDRGTTDHRPRPPPRRHLVRGKPGADGPSCHKDARSGAATRATASTSAAWSEVHYGEIVSGRLATSAAGPLATAIRTGWWCTLRPLIGSTWVALATEVPDSRSRANQSGVRLRSPDVPIAAATSPAAEGRRSLVPARRLHATDQQDHRGLDQGHVFL